MAVGIVKTFNEEKGYGFIETDEGEVVFVHHTSIEMEGYRSLSPGAHVLFDIVVGKRGPEAKQVRKI
jgi:CspA family cold shock protein